MDVATDAPGERPTTSGPLGERPSELHPPTDRDDTPPRAGPPRGESAADDPIAALLRAGALDPPERPGGPPRLDRFEALGALRAGGMGVVLRARDPATGGSVAIKLIRPDRVGDGSILKRFLKEARHMQRLRHPNLLEVFEVVERPAGPYYAIPLCERGSLAGLIARGPLDAATALRVARQVADALAYAHAEGIIHRDLKPSNVLIGDDGRALLADFGLVRSLDNDTILAHELNGRIGTAAYMSPGVASGRQEDTRSDIYAFGALLREMLTGRPPYRGRDAVEVLRQVLAGPPPALLAVKPDADHGLARIADGAMARGLRDRYASMDDIVADLDRVAGGEIPLGPRGAADRAEPATTILAPGPSSPTTRDSDPRRPGLGLVVLATAMALLAVGGVALLRQLLPRPAAPPWSPLSGRIDLRVWDPDDPSRDGVTLGPEVMPLESGDRVGIEAHVNRPAYLYVVWIDSEGHAQPVYPWVPGDWTRLAFPEARREHLRLPMAPDGSPGGWPMRGPPGMETLVLLARDEPLPASVDLRSRLSDLPAQEMQDPRALAWFNDWQVIRREQSRERGPNFFDVARVDDPVLRTENLLRERLGRLFPMMRAISFANRGDSG